MRRGATIMGLRAPDGPVILKGLRGRKGADQGKERGFVQPRQSEFEMSMPLDRSSPAPGTA